MGFVSQTRSNLCFPTCVQLSGTGEPSITSYAPTDEMQQLEAACDRRDRQPRSSRERLQPRYFFYTDEQIRSFTIWPVCGDDMGFVSQTRSNLCFPTCVQLSGPVSSQSPLMRPQMKCSSWRPPAIVGTVSPQPPATGCVN